MELAIQHDQQAHQFFTVIDGKTSLLKYAVLADGKTLDYYSTFVPPELRGRHIGHALVIFALNYARENNLKIIPSCPFIAKLIERHGEYKMLVVS